MLIALVVLSLVASTSLAASTSTAASFPSTNLVLKAIFSALGLNPLDVDTCMSDASLVETHLHDFSVDISLKDYSGALVELNSALSHLSTSIRTCDVPQLETKLDALAVALKFASIKEVDAVVEIFIDATDVLSHLSQLSVDVLAGDDHAIGLDLLSLIDDWSKISSDCTSSECKFVDGLLKVLQLVVSDVSGECLSDVSASLSVLSAGFAEFKDAENNSRVAALADIAKGLDDLALVFKNDVCQLSRLGSLIAPLASRLGKAIVNGDKVLVEFADLYDDLYDAALALQAHDAEAFGMALGRLAVDASTAGCETKACKVFVGILSAASLVAEDYELCLVAVDATASDFDTAIDAFEKKEWSAGWTATAKSLADLSNDVDACGAPQIVEALENVATAFGADAVATAMGSVVLLLVEGKDVAGDLSMAILDFQAGDWEAFGRDLGDIATFLKDEIHCNTFVCKVVEGIAEAAGIALTNLKVCEQDLKEVEADFVNAVNDFKSKKNEDGVRSLAHGLRMVGKALTDCGLGEELDFIAKEADVFGLAGVTIIDEAREVYSIVVHGFDFYDNVLDMVVDFEKKDWKSAGGEIHAIVDQLSIWSNGHVCQRSACYIVEGIMEFEKVLEGDIKQCEADFVDAWSMFTAAVNEFSDNVSAANAVSDYLNSPSTATSRKTLAAFGAVDLSTFSDSDMEILKTQLADNIKQAVKDIGLGLEDVAKGVGDCHLDDLAKLLEKLAGSMAFPVVSWISNIIHVLVNSVEIVEDIGEACVDFGDDNWVRFGFDIAKLIKVLV